ncbi:hypothetical protein LTR66_006095 [Elasticomyces elasticus]|nr:hypothetical protein LTR66_006095 [Elasticomyces elasticus]
MLISLRLWQSIVVAAGVAATALAASDAETPTQLRLAYAGDTGMHVSWNTFVQLAAPKVYYGTSPRHLKRTASSNVSVTYETSTTYNNHVKITGLEPDTLYYYQPEHSNATSPYSFRTSRPAGDHTPYTIAVVVDLGTMGADGLTTYVGKGADNPLKPEETNTIQSLEDFRDDFDFLWHAGDIAYADYWLKEEIQGFIPNTTIAEGYKVYERILSGYYDQMSPVSSYKPYMVGPGNHEANCDNGGYKDKAHNISYDVSICMPGQTNFTGYRNHFRMPSAESGGQGNFWYSFDHGLAHYIQLDTETDLGHGFTSPDEPGGSEHENSGPFGPYMDAQTDWLAKDLAAVNRTETPWIIVAGHRPWYISVANDTHDVCTMCKDVFEPLFLAHSVDLVFSGHVHAYQRNAPMYDNQADPAELDNPKFPWYITNGAAGHYDGLDALDVPLKDYARFALDTTYGWSRVTFHNCTHLTQEFVASGNGTVLDSATLFKDRVCAPDTGARHGNEPWHGNEHHGPPHPGPHHGPPSRRRMD